MSTVYNKATICPYDDQHCSETAHNRLELNPGITKRFAKSRDIEELKYLWYQWHEHSGKLMRENYKVYVDLMNKVAVGNNFTDAAAYWKDAFEDANFEENVDKLWDDVKPFYDELYTYMRYKLIEIYGKKCRQRCTEMPHCSEMPFIFELIADLSLCLSIVLDGIEHIAIVGDKVKENANIPAHLLGNMWAQSWTNLYEDTKPFKQATVVDVTSKLKQLNYTAKKMFELSDSFYGSLGLESNKMSYTKYSVIEKPSDRTIQCHASAWDFHDGYDYRIKMCTNINQKDLITIHHEMGKLYTVQLCIFNTFEMHKR